MTAAAIPAFFTPHDCTSADCPNVGARFSAVDKPWVLGPYPHITCVLRELAEIYPHIGINRVNFIKNSHYWKNKLVYGGPHYQHYKSLLYELEVLRVQIFYVPVDDESGEEDESVAGDELEISTDFFPGAS